MTLFYTDLDRNAVEVREIPKMGRHAVDSNLLFIDGLRCRGGPHRRGGQGLSVHPARHEPGAHPDRRRIGRPRPGGAARAARYANERIVFGRPIGQNQGIQHPLAERWVELEAAELLVMRAAAAYDAHQEPARSGPTPTPPNTSPAKPAPRLRDRDVDPWRHGLRQGVPRRTIFRETQIGRIAPVIPQLILSHIGERVLGLPKSY